MKTSSPYVRLLVTMCNGRAFATPPVPREVAEQYHADLLQNGRTVHDRDGCVLHTSPEHFVSFDYLACDKPVSEAKDDKRAA